MDTGINRQDLVQRPEIAGCPFGFLSTPEKGSLEKHPTHKKKGRIRKQKAPQQGNPVIAFLCIGNQGTTLFLDQLENGRSTILATGIHWATQRKPKQQQLDQGLHKRSTKTATKHKNRRHPPEEDPEEALKNETNNAPRSRKSSQQQRSKETQGSARKT